MKKNPILSLFIAIVLVMLFLGGNSQPALADTTPCSNWWASGNIIVAYQPQGAASLGNSYINLASPGTHDAAPGTAPTWNATNGWIFGGTGGGNNFLGTGIVGNNSYTAIVKISDSNSQTVGIFGEEKTTSSQTRLVIYNWNSDGNSYFRSGGNYNTTTHYTNGVLAVSPVSAYVNGSPIGSLSGAWTGTTTYTIYIGAENINGTLSAAFWQGNIQAFAIYNTTLTDSQILNVTNLLNGSCPTPTPTNTPTNTFTPTNTSSPTLTNTSTNTSTPTLTLTPTIANTSTNTSTLTLTPTITNTSTITPTPTITPNPSVIWAPSPFPVSIALQNALTTRLIANPPTGYSGNVYGIINAQTDGSGGWFVSLVNVVGISSPYTGWSALANGQWSGSLDCVGTEPSWTCTYYNPTPAVGGTGGLVFPWQSGTYAIYGQEGIHHDVNCPGGCALPGDDAVDFVSGDTLGASAMPPYAYAAEAGTVTWSCQGAHNGGLIISGASGKLMYFHLAPGQAAFSIGTTFQQGQEIGRLAYGTFDDSPCGYASQGATDYHLHFAWYPSGNTFSIGGCILDLTTQNWLCGTTTIGILGHLNNSGGTSPAPTASGPTITPGGPTVTPLPGQVGPSIGGEHVWNGIIQAVIDFIHANATAILPKHTSSTTLSDAVNNSWSTIMDFGWMIQSLQMIWVLPALIVWGIMLTVEIVRWIYVAYRTIVRLLPMP